ncbi:MAG: hypothetical protein ACP5NX_03215 [Candidatus Bilamarchaeaceae archaeon]
MMGDYSDLVEQAKAVEKSAMPASRYGGGIDLTEKLWLSPEEFSSMDYSAIINSYQRVEKIRKATATLASGAYFAEGETRAVAPKEDAKALEKKKEEVESKVIAISQTALEESKKFEQARRAAPIFETGHEFEETHERFEQHRYAEDELPTPTLSVPSYTGPAGAGEKKTGAEPSFEAPSEEKEAEAPRAIEPKEMPRPSAAQAQSEAPKMMLEREVERQAVEYAESLKSSILAQSGEAMSADDIKRRMLELTKQLFKEKSSSRKEAIKTEIAFLKTQLTSSVRKVPEAPSHPAEKARKISPEAQKAMEKLKARGGKVKAPEGRFKAASVQKTAAVSTSSQAQDAPPAPAPRSRESVSRNLFDSLVAKQVGEVAKNKDSLSSMVDSKLREARMKVQEALGSGETEEQAGLASAMLQKEILVARASIEPLVDNHLRLLIRKHSLELTTIASSPELSADAKKEFKDRASSISPDYSDDFDSFKRLLMKKFENGASEISASIPHGHPERPAEEAPVKPKQANAISPEETEKIAFEINGMDEGTLLYHLHSKDPDSYRQYERKKMQKDEAIFRAKKIMAKERKLPQEVINKYFGIDDRM